MRPLERCWLGGGQQGAEAYSQDLRDRVIDAVARGEMSRRAAARRYASQSVAIKWLERVERDGSREPVGTAATGVRCRTVIFCKPRGPRRPTSRFRLFAIAFRPSAGSKPTPR